MGTTLQIHTTDNRTNQPVVYDIQLVGVIDPAQGQTQFDTPDAGNRLVGAELKITGISGSMQRGDDDADANTLVIGTNHQTYQPDFVTLAAGTDFDSGDFTTSQGSVSVGYVPFQVPQGIGISEIHWAELYGSSQTAAWTVS